VDRMPTARYKIIERDRRLVTIDLATGIEVGQKVPLVPTSSAPLSEKITARVAEAVRPSALAPMASRPGVVPSDKAGRIAILIAGGLITALVLIISGGWIPVAVVMAIPPIRSVVLTAAKAAIQRFINP
jgi:hypothetical protein